MSRHGRGGRGRHLLETFGLGAVSLGAAAGAIGATYKIAEAAVKAKRLFDVRSENAVFVRLIEGVQIDLAEVDRLLALKEVKEALRHNKGKTIWVKGKVEKMHEAIESMSKYTRKVAGAGWWLGIKTRIWWVVDEHEKLMHREMELAMAREGILAVIEYLNQFEKNPVKKEERERVDYHAEDGRREERNTTRVIELDYEGRPRRETKRYKEYDYVEEDDEVEMERPMGGRSWAQEGFYEGQLDGPLSTRPRFWHQQSAGADYAVKREDVREEEPISNDRAPLRVHWPTSKL